MSKAKVVALCKALKIACPGCNRVFRRDERYIDCPDCGTSRKCGSFPMRGSVFCRRHGGKPNLKHKYSATEGRPIMTGRNSKSLVANLASKYVEISKSGPYQTNKATVDVLDVRITELLTRVDQKESPERLKNIIDAWSEVKKAVPGLKIWLKDNKKGQEAYNSLDDEVEKAYHDYEAWKQIMQVFDLRRKVTKDEMSILKDMQALISAEDAYELSAQLLAAVLLVLGDEPDGSRLINAIHSEFKRILGESHAGSVAGRGEEIIDVDPLRVD